jgi:GNAT superfamily N-acetyltransferase
MAGLPAGFHLRLAETSEAERLLDIMLRCWTGTVASNSTAYGETAEIIADQLERGVGAFVCEGDTIVGSGRFLPVPGPPGDPREWVEIKRVGILKSHRKLDLGAPLVAALEAEAQRRSYPGAQLGVRSDQPRLVAFWASLGYLPADDVQLHVVNPVTPPPTTMRKRFERTG